MRKSLLFTGACALSVALSAGVAAAGDQYYGYGGRGYDNGYGGYYDDGRYSQGGSYHRAYLRFLRECRKHRRLHRDLRAEHRDAHREGFEDYSEHREEHDALHDVHRQYHRANPVANYCPTYRQWRSRYDRGYYNRGYRYGDD